MALLCGELDQREYCERYLSMASNMGDPYSSHVLEKEYYRKLEDYDCLRVWSTYFKRSLRQDTNSLLP